MIPSGLAQFPPFLSGIIFIGKTAFRQRLDFQSVGQRLDEKQIDKITAAFGSALLEASRQKEDGARQATVERRLLREAEG